MSRPAIETTIITQSTFPLKEPLINPSPVKEPSKIVEAYLSRPGTLQFWASVMVVLPVFLQAPWVHLQPVSACLFTFVLLGTGLAFAELGGERYFQVGSLLIGVSGSWLGGCLFWGWLRAYPVWHLPVEAVAFPLACFGLTTRWKLGAGFYLSCLLGTACTDLMMVVTGVMSKWPQVVLAPFSEAPDLLNQAAANLLKLQPLFLLVLAGLIIFFLARLMRQRANLRSPFGGTWLVASAALTTTLWVDGLFLLTALFHPRLSGLI